MYQPVILIYQDQQDKISHQMALDKSALEYDKFRETQKQIQHGESARVGARHRTFEPEPKK
jgi:hypothetical protein